MSETCNRCGGLFGIVEGEIVPILRCRDCGREVPAGAIHGATSLLLERSSEVTDVGE